MKNTLLALLVITLLVGIANLLFNLGILGEDKSSKEFRVLNGAEMDKIGFMKLAELNNIEISKTTTKPSASNTNFKISFKENGQYNVINFPKSFTHSLMKTNLLPFTINTIEEEGWSLVTVTADNHYIFRKR